MKKKIKLVISDLHLGNGRHLPDGTINPLEDFLNDEKFIEFVLHHHAYPEETQIELILNGDFFNMIQLLREEQDDGILTERAAVKKTKAIIQGHRDMFDALRQFNSRPHRRVVFVLGNHDPGLLWPKVQETIREAVEGEVIFVDDFYRFDGVHIEHGHQLEQIFQFDSCRYFLTRGYPEPVLNLPWGVFFVKDFLYEMKRRRPFADKVKPYHLYWRWSIYNDFWFAILSMFRYFRFVMQSLLSDLPLKRQGALRGFSAMMELGKSTTMEEDARKIMERENCRIVILGHTHIPIHRNLGNEREYLNPGCWNHITSLDLAHLGYTRRLIYVQIDYAENKPTARLMEWHGQHRVFEELRV